VLPTEKLYGDVRDMNFPQRFCLKFSNFGMLQRVDSGRLFYFHGKDARSHNPQIHYLETFRRILLPPSTVSSRQFFDCFTVYKFQSMNDLNIHRSIFLYRQRETAVPKVHVM
jgi:hypothetical protein